MHKCLRSGLILIVLLKIIPLKGDTMTFAVVVYFDIVILPHLCHKKTKQNNETVIRYTICEWAQI